MHPFIVASVFDQLILNFQYYGYFFVVLATIFAMIASAGVSSTFRRYSAHPTRRGLTGAAAAERVLRQGGAYDVRIARTAGRLTDHFNPKDRTVYLSDAVYDSTSCAAIGVAAHEAGHALQHAEGYVPIRIRSALVPVTNFGSRLAMPLILIGLFLGIYAESAVGFQLSMFGVIAFSLCVIFQLVTLPVEFNASRRAVVALEEGGLLDEEELMGAKKTLRAAAMTYVASLAVSLTQFLRLLAVVLGSRGRRRQ